jgi:type 1 glutamine amidotransferase
LNAQSLAELSAVVFYTTGELPIPPADREAFLDWMLHGGAFVGIHCATDTFYQYAPYQRLVGGVFDGHPWHQEIRVDVLDGAHPATANLERGFLITDEIYQFKDFERAPLRELLRLEPSSVDLAKGKRADGDYALAWCREYGQGRVFYTALGHRPEVWADPRFRAHLLGGLSWAIRGGDWKPEAPDHSVVLTGNFAGLRAWEKRDGSPSGWLADEGVIEVVPGAGDAVTHAVFGDALFHVEFAVPAEQGEGEARGNSGVYLMGRYEIQVLDSFGRTPGKGDCAAIYGVKAPSVNASKPALAWQTFDARLRAPRFDQAGAKTENARLSLWHNGVLVHDDVELQGPTPGGLSDKEAALGPLLLQEHGHAVRYRNVWVGGDGH